METIITKFNFKAEDEVEPTNSEANGKKVKGYLYRNVQGQSCQHYRKSQKPLCDKR